MKKSLMLLTALLFCLIGAKLHAGIYISKSGGGPNGYKDIKEEHSGGTHSLDCKNPGYNPCVWTIQPSLVAGTTGNQYTADQIAAMVETQISNNILQGSFYLDGDPNIQVSWYGTDINDYTMQVDDSEI